MSRIIHESVAGVLHSVGVKPRGSALGAANNRATIVTRDPVAVIEGTAADGSVVVELHKHPKLADATFTAANLHEGKITALRACTKAGGFPIFEEKDGKLLCTFTRDKAKATVTEESAIKAAKIVAEEESEDETDGTGEASGDTTTNVKTDPKGKGADPKAKMQTGATKDLTETATETAGSEAKVFNKEGLEKFKAALAKKKALAGKKMKTPEEKTEEVTIDAELEALCESFYDSLSHSVTFVLYPNGQGEVHGLTEDELSLFGGTAPAIPVKYSKKAKDAGPNSKVDMGVLSLYKIEGMTAQSAQILTGKDFKAQGWGTPGKGTGKVAGWKDSGKQPLDAKKDLKSGMQ
jgi:uncharacterized Zn finger protein (UPF0148 family)